MLLVPLFAFWPTLIVVPIVGYLWRRMDDERWFEYPIFAKKEQR
jgi:hypothetical protein